MYLDTARFGHLSYNASDLVLFPDGLIGFEHLHAWLPLREGSLYWLQAVEEPAIALPVVSPFDYVINYRFRLDTDDCRSLDIGSRGQVAVLAVVGHHGPQWTLNLRAPILIRPDLRLGCQLVSRSEHSLQHVLPRATHNARKSA